MRPLAEESVEHMCSLVQSLSGGFRTIERLMLDTGLSTGALSRALHLGRYCLNVHLQGTRGRSRRFYRLIEGEEEAFCWLAYAGTMRVFFPDVSRVEVALSTRFSGGVLENMVRWRKGWPTVFLPEDRALWGDRRDAREKVRDCCAEIRLELLEEDLRSSAVDSTGE